MTTQKSPEERDIPFRIMADGKTDMTFISKSVSGALEFQRVCFKQIGTPGNAAATQDEVDVGKGIINCAMQAFALECALKGAYQALGEPFVHTHDLHRLYADLPQEIKQQIEEGWKAWTLFPETATKTFQEFVRGHKRDFEDWRYLQGHRLESAYFAFFAGTRSVNHVADTVRGSHQT